jgi:hypothetical protein
MTHSATLPFTLKRSRDVLGAAEITTTTETVHGLLYLDGERLVIQWRLARKIETLGEEIRTDEEFEDVRQVVVPLEAVAGATVRRAWWRLWSAPLLVLRAVDLRAFEKVTGEGGLRLAHPAELVLRLRRSDRLAAEEFSAELALAVAQLAAARGLDHSLPGNDTDEAPHQPQRTEDSPPLDRRLPEPSDDHS